MSVVIYDCYLRLLESYLPLLILSVKLHEMLLGGEAACCVGVDGCGAVLRYDVLQVMRYSLRFLRRIFYRAYSLV